MMSGSHLSKDFFDLVKAIGESKSKQQEDSIIVEEVQTLKRRMVEANVSKKKMKEFLIRLVYVEMLGHDASFGYIKAIELAASKNLVQKRVGYLCSGLCLSPSHEFRFMLVNQLQQDMASANYLEVAAALSAMLRLATPDMIPALADRVIKLGSHGKELVRKKVAMVLHRFHQLDKGAVGHVVGDAMRRTLCDKDPSVMCAALCLLHDMIVEEPGKLKELVPSFVSILKQVVEHRLPRDFDYHRIPAPWAQLRLLRVLAHLGRADQRASEGMYEVLSDAMRRADAGINAGYAIVYECVRTITTIYPNTTLLDEAAKSIARFLASENNNLKYLGITGLTHIVEQHPKYAAQHQLAVIECLEDVDDTLKRKTLDLLYRMINPVNVEFIATKLIQSLESSTDEFLRSALVSRLCTAAERFAPSTEWYVATVIKVLELAGDLVQPDVSQNLVALLAETEDDGLRASAVDEFASMLSWESVPESLLHILAWVVGEYGALCTTVSPDDLPGALCELCADDARLRGSTKTRSLLMAALCKTTARALERTSGAFASTSDFAAINALATKYTASSTLDLQQRALEFLGLMDLRADLDLLIDVVPYDASLEDPFEGEGAAAKGDDVLAFLDKFVASALTAGAAPYAPPEDDDDDDDDDDNNNNNNLRSFGAGNSDARVSLKYEAYDRPTRPAAPQRVEPPPPQAPQHLPPMASRAAANAIGAGRGLAATTGPWGRPNAPPPQQPDVPANNNVEPAVSASVSPPPPQELSLSPPARVSEEIITEKQRMAAALFGGVLSDEPRPPTPKSKPPLRSAKPPGSSRTPQRQPPKPKTTTPPPPPPAVESQRQKTPPPRPEISLLDLVDDAPPQAPPPQSMGGASTLAAVLDDPFAAVPAPPAPSEPFAPARLSTRDFGARWGSCRQERAADVVPNVPQLTLDFVSTRLAALGMHPVDAIPASSELILATTHLASGTQCLAHAKLVPQARKVALKIRSMNLQATQDVLASAISSLETDH
ncbi:hypothetical protein CTAYLR_008415 [Chrysophaeum taylorii]|uniref:AP-4 complex subunit epsilon-1 C-terminal domain-containing protein n=1 Tax=Chrysophaeum taylorii TaxID=2483200 RepID=A0AAD7UK18_9STRA|nr:hypothetical protein CTAYLR_008415 [Chrysophaeum taylorii]